MTNFFAKRWDLDGKFYTGILILDYNVNQAANIIACMVLRSPPSNFFPGLGAMAPLVPPLATPLRVHQLCRQVCVQTVQSYTIDQVRLG